MEKISEYMTSEKLTGYWETILPSVSNIAIGLAMLIIGMWFAKRIGNIVKKNAGKAPNIDATLANFLGSIAKYALTLLSSWLP